jgi:hypothetical protein
MGRTMTPRVDSRLVVGAVVLALGVGLDVHARAGRQTTPVPPQGQGLSGQQPARDAQNLPAVGTGEIGGTIMLEGAGSPVRHARVSLNGAELRGGRSTVTDDQGRFSFTVLPAGHFTLSASKPSYVTITYGAKKPGRPGTPIDLAAGQKLDKLVMQMPKGSVLAGIVVDETGEPSPQTQVRAMRYVLQTGDKTLQQAGQAQTDDRGMYRIFGLLPGDYVVSAVPRNMNNIGDVAQTVMAEVQSLMQQAQAAPAGGAAGRGGQTGVGALSTLASGSPGQQYVDLAAQLQQQLQQQQTEQAMGYAPVYYPGTTTAAAAATVTLAVGEERAGVDFQLQLVATARVEGRLASADGVVPPNTMITMVPVGQPNMPSIPGANQNSARVDQSGKFTFSNVTPGQYTLMARAAVRDPNAATGPQPGRAGGFGPVGRNGITEVLWASTDVTVGGQNLTDLILTLQPGMTVSGHLVFQGSTLQPPADLTAVRVMLTPQGQQAVDLIGGLPPAQVDATGRFTIKGVAPGRYILRGNAAAGIRGQGAGNWLLKSAVVNGIDTLDFPMEIRPNEDATGATLTFTDQTQELSGTLVDAAGRPTSDYTIVVFTADKSYWTPQSRRIVSARPGTDGQFSVRGLPPGEYRLTAVTDVEPGEWYDPAFLSQLLGSSMAVSLTAGEKKTQDVKIAGGGAPAASSTR